MNKKHWIIACVLMLAVIGIANAQQYEAEKNFTVQNVSGGVRITEYKGKNTNVNIPPQIKKLPVVEIGYAFSVKGLTAVTIPNGVTSIGQRAFYGNRLTSVIIPNSVTSIGEEAFEDNKITQITIGSNIKISSNAFDDEFVQAYTRYGKRAGTYSINDEFVAIEQQLGRGKAFSLNIQKWVNPEAELEIAKEQAEKDAAEMLLTTPNSGDDFAIEQNKQGGITITGYKGTRRNVIIPATIEGIKVTEIGEKAFAKKGIISVTIPNSVTGIAGDKNNGAFSECASLTSVTIPNSVTVLGECAFYKCTSLAGITIPNSITRIDSAVFRYCTSLTNITIPGSVTEIGSSAFADCTSLASVTIPNSVTSIKDGAFYKCTSLTSVTLPNRISNIDDETFAYCTSITNIIIPNGVTIINSEAFKGCTSLTNIIIPDSVTTIGLEAFRGCTSLTSVTIGNKVNEFATYYAFYEVFDGCTSLANITLGSALTKLDYRFNNFPITSITIGANKDYADKFPNNFATFYESQGKKAGTYTWSGRLWSVK